MKGDEVTTGSDQVVDNADGGNSPATRSAAGGEIPINARVEGAPEAEHDRKDDSDRDRKDDSDRADEDGPSGSAAVPLQSLTPRYVEENHETYLRRLEEAIKDPRNRNIALTGRYGAGKSSVLDKFEADHRKDTQRLAISTLAPDKDG